MYGSNVEAKNSILIHNIAESHYPIINFQPIQTKKPLQSKSGHWSEKEQAKYYVFIQKFEEKFGQATSRRHCKIFKCMAEFIETRNANQCRSHHHKMTKNFENINQTMTFIIKKNSTIAKKIQKYKQQLKLLKFFEEENGQDEANQKINNENSFKEQEKNFHQPYIFNSQNFYDFKPENKYLDIASLKTDVLLDHQNPSFQTLSQPFNQSMAKSFPSTGLLPTSLTSLDFQEPQYFPTVSQINSPSYETTAIYPIGFSNLSTYIMPYEMQEKWIQCHSSFLKWANKLNGLLYEEF